MNNTFAAKTLLFRQQEFFTKEQFVSGLKLPLILTLAYACIAAVFQSGSNIISALTIIATILIGWVIVSAVFFVFVNKLGHAECSIKEILAVTGYGSLPLLIGAILSGIVGFTGGMSSTLTALFNIGVLLWCIPIWVYGISLAANISPKQALTLIAIPIIAMAALDLWSTLGSAGGSMSGSPSSSGGGGTMVMTNGGGGNAGFSSGGGPPSGGGGGVRVQM